MWSQNPKLLASSMSVHWAMHYLWLTCMQWSTAARRRLGKTRVWWYEPISTICWGRKSYQIVNIFWCFFVCLHAQSLQLYPTLCDPMDCSPPGSSIHGILQARVLEWVPFPSPEDLPDQESNLGLLHYGQILYPLSHQGRLYVYIHTYIHTHICQTLV